MKKKITKYISVILTVTIGILCLLGLMMYVSPMEDVSLNLTMGVEDGEVTDPSQFDSKGWTVYIQEGDVKTELEADGFGGFTGLELGQTFYFSRILTEELDNPTLQLGTVDRTFSVWLDDDLIYTDCPEADNRIGYLHLPMSETIREEDVTVTLPLNYQGKTLTIAQSFPEWSETDFVRAYPAATVLNCGYAYESTLISESFTTAFLAAAAFLIGVILLLAFVRGRDWSLLCLAFVAFVWMLDQLIGTSFFYRYFDSSIISALSGLIPMLTALALLVFLTLRGGRYSKLLWVPVGLYALSVVACGVIRIFFPLIVHNDLPVRLITQFLPFWLAFICLMPILVLSLVSWRKENRFYRVFAPTALICVLASWLISILFVDQGRTWRYIVNSLRIGQIDFIFFRFLNGTVVAALFTAITEWVTAELKRRAEQQMMAQSRELALASYENLRRQHEEVMMIRHDMLRHFRALHDMGGDEKRTAYLADLIGQNEKIRPVVESGNEMLDIILGGRLGAAVDAGIRVEIPHVTAPAQLPLSDPDLCALIMNIVDNAISAASKAPAPYIMLKIHEKEGYLGIVCENSYDPQETKEETVPKHGLGLKIIQGIVTKYSGTFTEDQTSDRFTVKIVLPLT